MFIESKLLNRKPQLFEITAYIPTGNLTATGVPAIPYRSAAVDPAVVPYNRWLFIQGLGWYKAEDTGDSVVNRTGLPVIDICVASEVEAYNWGRRPRKVWIVREGDLLNTIKLLIKNGYTAKQVYQYLFSPLFVEAQGSYLTPYHLVELIADLLPITSVTEDTMDVYVVSISHTQQYDIGIVPKELEMTEPELQKFLGMENLDPSKWAEIFMQGGPVAIGNVDYKWRRRTP